MVQSRSAVVLVPRTLKAKLQYTIHIRFSEHNRPQQGSSFPPRVSTSWWSLSAPASSTSCINQSFSTCCFKVLKSGTLSGDWSVWCLIKIGVPKFKKKKERLEYPDSFLMGECSLSKYIINLWRTNKKYYCIQ
jgi:hypothetical protein